MRIKKFLFLTIIVLLITSCTKKTELVASLNCKRKLGNFKLKKATDFNKKFSILFPNTWKTKLYYDNFQSEIMVADTLKSLTNSFIYDASWNYGEIEINQEFKLAIDTKLQNETGLKKTQFGSSTLENKPMYWHLFEGKKNKRDFQLFKAYIKTGIDSYLMVNVNFYGIENKQERLCFALEILQTTKFL